MSEWHRGAAVRWGPWVAFLAAAGAATTLVVGITTPPRSGPYCRSGCLVYPYLDAASFVPRDYLWMYPAMLTALLAALLAMCVHAASPGPRLSTLAGVAFAVTGAGTLVVDYAIQLTVMQPSLLSGETAGLSPLSQYNPHGVFIGLENVGYAALAVSFVALGLGLAGGRPGPVRASGWILLVAGSVAMLALFGYAIGYGARLEYRFEVAAIGLTCLGLIVAGPLLGLAFLRARRGASP